MIGLSGAIGYLHPDKDFNKLYAIVHAAEDVNMASHNFSNRNCAISLIGRKLPFDDGFENLFYENPEYVIFIEGYVCFENSTEKADELNDAAVVLREWKRHGSNFIVDLNGEYNIAIYHKKSREAFIINDRFASRPIYYTAENNTLLFASEKKAIFCVSQKQPRISYAGVMEFFAFSHNIANRTIFEDVHALPPASILSFKNGAISIKQYWRLGFSREDSKQMQMDLVRDMATLLRQAAESKYRGRHHLGLGLSGGLDSRLVAATIPKNIRPVFARTYGRANSMEVKVAKAIAERLSLTHFVHGPKDISFSSFLYPSVWRTEVSVHFTGLRSILEHQNLKDRMWYNLIGHFGDVLTGKQLRPFMFRRQKRDNFIKRVFSHYVSNTYRNVNAFGRIFNTAFFNEYFGTMRCDFYKSFVNIEAENNWDLYDVWDMTNRQTRFTFCSSAVDNHLFTKIVLFTDYHYVDYMLKIPGYLRFGQVLYKRMIATQFKKISSIPNSNTGKLLGVTHSANLIDLAWQYYVSKRRKFQERSSGTLGTADLISADTKLRHILTTFIKSDLFPSDIFSRNGVLGMLDDHYSGRANNSYVIGVFATFVAGYELFVLKRFNQPFSSTVTDIN